MNQFSYSTFKDPFQLPLALAIDYFSQFLAKILEKDPKYNLYLKEWETLKSLLTRSPVDHDAVILYLAGIQLNTENKPTIPDVESYHIPNTIYASPRKTERSVTHHKRVQSDKKTEYPYDWSSDLASIGIYSTEASREVSRDSVLPDRRSSLPDMTFTKALLNDLKDTTLMNEILGLPTEKPEKAAKYDMSYLAARAKGYKENYSLHSTKLIQEFNKTPKKVEDLSTTDRTSASRAAITYSTQSPMNNPLKKAPIQYGIYSGFQDYTLRIRPDPKLVHFENALVMY